MTQAQPEASLLIQTGDFAGLRYSLVKEETLIGRNPTNDITLVDDGISREHTMILFDADEGGYVIEDLQSTNGTKVNGKRVRSAPLSDGDEVEIGHTNFLFSVANPKPG